MILPSWLPQKYSTITIGVTIDVSLALVHGHQLPPPMSKGKYGRRIRISHHKHSRRTLDSLQPQPQQPPYISPLNSKPLPSRDYDLKLVVNH